ncbi:MAG: hypothetical protein EXR71_12820 [Myxococcales bacterium]|nr:hypothetical protein [Myxococcales bacterium]
MGRVAPTVCRICEAHCGLIATVEASVVTRLSPDAERPLSKGRPQDEPNSHRPRPATTRPPGSASIPTSARDSTSSGIGRRSSTTPRSPGSERNAAPSASTPQGTVRAPSLPSTPAGLTSAEGRAMAQASPLPRTIASHSPFIVRYAPAPPAP